MTNEKVKEWIEALRSGNYKQGTAELRTIDPDGQGACYCCLGVLCDINSDLGEWDGHTFVSVEDDGDCAILPLSVSQHLDIPTDGFKFEVDVLNDFFPEHVVDSAVRDMGDNVTGWANLVALNDSGATFEQIAELLEAKCLNDNS